jgi:hypothetical protein
MLLDAWQCTQKALIAALTSSNLNGEIDEQASPLSDLRAPARPAQH